MTRSIDCESVDSTTRDDSKIEEQQVRQACNYLSLGMLAKYK